MRRPAGLPPSARLLAAIAKGLAYLQSKQSDDGGFCFFKGRYFDRPNLRDSHHAVSALRLWGCAIPREDMLLRFLKREEKQDVDALFYFTSVLTELGLEHAYADVLARITELVVPPLNLNSSPDTGRWLERTYRTLELQRRAGRVEESEGIYRAIQSLECNGGYGDGPNLRETHLSLKALALMGRPPADLKATRRFVDELQHQAIGFTDLPRAQLGNLEVLAAGIECCALLGLAIRYPADALTFALACQCADGSFSRVPVALPDIVRTHQALQISAWVAPDAVARARASARDPKSSSDNTTHQTDQA